MHIVFRFFASLLISMLHCYTANATHSYQYLFKNHKEGYSMYRIPAIVKAKNGRLLAFCEGRTSLKDNGNIDLVLKISDDNGNTWSALKVIWNDGNNTCGNPAPVVDTVTGDIVVLATWNNNRVFVLRSKENGNTWETPVDITSSVKDMNWSWYATGPVHGIQLQQNSYKNRIVIACNHTITSEGKHIAHTVYSDDHGVTWTKSYSVPTKGTDESTVVELGDGRLLLNMRNNDRTMPNRKVSYSADGGATWQEATFDTTLIEPVCQGTLLRYSTGPSILLFSNPHHKSVRKNLTLMVSRNEGQTWSQQIVINKALSAYSDIVKLDDGRVICLFETGRLLPYSGIVFQYIAKEAILK